MRTQYANGNGITLQSCGCDGCSPSSINGVFCHEQGCPEAWQDRTKDCPNCRKTFFPDLKDDCFCSDDCREMYYG